MCRLAFVTKPFDGLTAWLHQLELSAGGDGNGVAVGGEHAKGVEFTVDHAVGFWHDRRKRAKTRKRARPPMLFHTRRTSSGGDCDELCHPFPCAGGWLAHNGHWQLAHERSQLWTQDRGPMSDTRYFSMVVEEMGFERAVVRFSPPGVWLHMTGDGLLSAYKGSGQLHYSPDLDAWGSEPADAGEWWPVGSGLLWGYGERPEKSAIFVVPKKISFFPLHLPAHLR